MRTVPLGVNARPLQSGAVSFLTTRTVDVTITTTLVPDRGADAHGTHLHADNPLVTRKENKVHRNSILNTLSAKSEAVIHHPRDTENRT